MLLLLLCWGSGLPPHYAKIIYGDIVTSCVKVVIYWGRCLLMFLEPLSKGSWGLSNIFLITLHPVTLVSINDPTHLLDRILIFWSHQEILDGVASFKIDLHSMFTAYFLQALTQPHLAWFLVVVVLARVSGISSIFVGWTLCLDLNSYSEPMQGIHIFGVLSVDILLPVAGTYGFSSMMEGTNHAIFWWHCVMTVPL